MGVRPRTLSCPSEQSWGRQSSDLVELSTTPRLCSGPLERWLFGFGSLHGSCPVKSPRIRQRDWTSRLVRLPHHRCASIKWPRFQQLKPSEKPGERPTQIIDLAMASEGNAGFWFRIAQRVVEVPRPSCREKDSKEDIRIRRYLCRLMNEKRGCRQELDTCISRHVPSTFGNLRGCAFWIWLEAAEDSRVLLNDGTCKKNSFVD